MAYAISEKVRERIGNIVCLLNCLLGGFGLVLIALSVFVKISIESRLIYLEGYEVGVFPRFLFAVGFVMFFVNIFTAKVAHETAFIETRLRFKKFLLISFVFTFFLQWFILAGGLMCFVQLGVIEDTIGNGFMPVMRKYKTNLSVKLLIDRLQQQYRCCGSNRYSDWFEVNWINEEYMNMKNKEVIRKLRNGLYYSDDVPFSCCDITLLRPCIHQSVANKSSRQSYGSVTLYKRGCATTLMIFFEDIVLAPTGFSIIIAFFVQMISVVLLRFLQTSIHDAYRKGNPKGIGVGYCLSKSGFCKFNSGRNPYRRDNYEGSDYGEESDDNEEDYDENSNRRVVRGGYGKDDEEDYDVNSGRGVVGGGYGRGVQRKAMHTLQDDEGDYDVNSGRGVVGGGYGRGVQRKAMHTLQDDEGDYDVNIGRQVVAGGYGRGVQLKAMHTFTAAEDTTERYGEEIIDSEGFDYLDRPDRGVDEFDGRYGRRGQYKNMHKFKNDKYAKRKQSEKESFKSKYKDDEYAEDSQSKKDSAKSKDAQGKFFNIFKNKLKFKKKLKDKQSKKGSPRTNDKDDRNAMSEKLKKDSFKSKDKDAKDKRSKKGSLKTEKNSPKAKTASPKGKKVSLKDKMGRPEKKKGSPKANVSPTRKKVSPTRKKVSPTRKKVSPKRKKVSPTRKKVSPKAKKTFRKAKVPKRTKKVSPRLKKGKLKKPKQTRQTRRKRR